MGTVVMKVSRFAQVLTYRHGRRIAGSSPASAPGGRGWSRCAEILSRPRSLVTRVKGPSPCVPLAVQKTRKESPPPPRPRVAGTGPPLFSITRANDGKR
jgi:hypothetical protein